MNKVVYVNQDGSVEVVNGPGGEVDRLARTYIAEHGLDRAKDYGKAWAVVLDQNPALKLAYAGELDLRRDRMVPVPDTRFEAVRAKYSRKFPDAAQASDGRELVDAVIRGELALNPNESYGTVYRRVLANDAELRAVYR